MVLFVVSGLGGCRVLCAARRASGCELRAACYELCVLYAVWCMPCAVFGVWRGFAWCGPQRCGMVLDDSVCCELRASSFELRAACYDLCVLHAV
eukprot:2486472-Alexandrium_andersonii.AAC.1